MSFFSSIFGGSSISQQSTQSSGYGALPQFAQDAYKSLVDQATPMFANGAGTAAYTPQQTAATTQAYGMEQPMTQQSVSDLTGNYMNPFISGLLAPVLNQYNGQNSLYQQQAAQAGLSPGNNNRDFLNTGYLQGQEDNAIGNVLGTQYQNALSTGLSQNQLTIQNLLGQGQTQQSLALQQQQAPQTALDAFGQLLGLLPSTSTGQSSGQSSSSPGILSSFGSSGGAGNALGTIGTLLSFL